MTQTKLHPSAQGQAGVLRVASELILRGHEPWIPAVDRGVDLLVDGLVRVQVKSTLRATSKARTKTWSHQPGTLIFSLSQTVHVVQKQYRRCAPRVFTDFCDIVVLWAITDNRFWIVPAHLLNRRHSISIGPQQQWHEIDVDKARSLRASGLSYQAIASALGTERETVMRRLNLSPVPRKPLPSVEIRKCEGRWDLIDQFVNTANQVNALPESKTDSLTAKIFETS